MGGDKIYGLTVGIPHGPLLKLIVLVRKSFDLHRPPAKTTALIKGVMDDNIIQRNKRLLMKVRGYPDGMG